MVWRTKRRYATQGPGKRLRCPSPYELTEYGLILAAYFDSIARLSCYINGTLQNTLKNAMAYQV